jgi:hypothetical protein
MYHAFRDGIRSSVALETGNRSVKTTVFNAKNQDAEPEQRMEKNPISQTRPF